MIDALIAGLFIGYIAGFITASLKEAQCPKK